MCTNPTCSLQEINPPPSSKLPTGRMENDLLSLAACLTQPLSSVTQLSIQLRGEDTRELENPLIVAAATAVRILGPLCGSLTHITVSGQVRTWAENTYTFLLDAASAVCAASLTHFSFSMQVRHMKQSLRPGEQDVLLECGCDFLLDLTACEALSSFTRLTYLKLQHGSVSDPLVWAVLPPSLQCLEICSPYCDIPDDHVFHNLHKLCMLECDCYNLIQLLEACPLLQQLHLVQLYTPTCPEELEDLEEIMKHPVWCANNSGHTRCTPVARLHQAGAWEPGDPVHMAPWVVLPALPVMPTISIFRFNFIDGQTGPHLFLDPVPLLHHIPRLFPHLEVLCMEHVLKLDADLTELYSCSSLRQLDLRGCGAVTGEALLALAEALPKMVCIEIQSCKGVHSAHRKAIAALMKKRMGHFRKIR